MAIGNAVSYWYGTKAQYNAISVHSADMLYFIIDEQTIYKGDVRFAEGIEQLSKIGTSAPPSPAKYDKYFNTNEGKIYVYNGTSWGNAYYPADGSMYYDQNMKRFVYFTATYTGTDVTGGSMSDVYDAGVSGDAAQGVSMTGASGSTVTVANASTTQKGVVKIGDNLNAVDGVISVPVAGNTSTNKGVVFIDTGATGSNGISLALNTNTGALTLTVTQAASGVYGTVALLTSFNPTYISVNASWWDQTEATRYATTMTAVREYFTTAMTNSACGLSVDALQGHANIADASTTQKGIIKLSTTAIGLTLTNGILSLGNASTASKGVVQLSPAAVGLTITNGILNLGDASTISKGVVQIHPTLGHITVSGGIISVDEATSAVKGVVALSTTTTYTGTEKTSNVKAVTPAVLTTEVDTLNSAKQNNLVQGFHIELSGATVNQARYNDIEEVTGATVTLLAGHAYKISATGSAKKLVTETIPSGKFGMEGHAEIFVTDTGYITTADNVVLVDALESNAVNNCTLRFHDGFCLISVEDHVAGYITRSATGRANGSIYYGLTTDAKEYISVDASLNGHLLETDEAVITITKSFVGNGSDMTVVECDMTVNAALSMVECTVKPMNISGTGSLTLVNTVLDFTDATSAEPITLTDGVKIGANVTIIDGSGNEKHLDPRMYGTIKKNGETTGANYVYGYAQGTTQATANYIPIVLENNVIKKVDALDVSKMACHERRVCVMDDLSTRHINYYLNPENLNKKLDGGDAVLDGTDGDVMTEFMPSYFLSIQLTPQNDTTPRNCILMSRYPFTYTDGNNVEHVAVIHDSFKVSPDGNTIRPQYMGYYQASTITDNGTKKLRSISSKSTAYIYPTVSLKLGPVGSDGDSVDSFLNRAIANGGSVCNDLHYQWLFHLYVCQKLTVHTQDTSKGSLGFGWASSTSWGSFYPRACGYTNETENFYGGSTYADSRDADMEAMWNGSWIETTTGGVTTRWASDAAGCVVTTDSTTGKRGISCNRWRSGANTTENPYVYLYTKASDGMPTISTQLYTDNTCETTSSLTISAVNSGAAYANRVTACKYFIENPWGSLWQNLAGLLPICTGNSIGYFRTTSTNRYKELLKIPISEAGTSRAASGENAAIDWVSFAWPSTSNWITTWNMETFYPTSTGSNVMQDYFYNSTTASPRAGRRGGTATSTSSSVGLGYVYVSGAVGYAYDYLGARLSA